MLSPEGERALFDALSTGRALVKFISANDVGTTGSHQYGFYLPKAAWQLYSPYSPDEGENYRHDVQITWPDGLITSSRVYWYGRESRSEYRLTRFGHGFPWIQWNRDDNVGDLLVIIPHTIEQFSAYILSHDEDIEELLAGLGIEITDTWGYMGISNIPEEIENNCLDYQFRQFVHSIDELPSGAIFSDTTVHALNECVTSFDLIDPDSKLLRLVKEEYALYRMAEKEVFGPSIQRVYNSLDEFLQTANSILQSRKSRAGRSLENHVEYILIQAGIPFSIRPTVDGTKPDVLIPGVEQYEDLQYPTQDLFMIGIKRTCKDRWRQVTREAPRIPQKHLLTLQRGVSSNQFEEMTSLNVSLVVPKQYHSDYPSEIRSSILSIEAFLEVLTEHIHYG
ncbi:MAG: type II restriction endonuclease [Chloroflexota bacterium]|nr:type II restriction endonuclease [Chloroflexota bacterium]